MPSLPDFFATHRPQGKEVSKQEEGARPKATVLRFPEKSRSGELQPDAASGNGSDAPFGESKD